MVSVMFKKHIRFVGPKDIFRNPEAIFRFFEPTTGVEANQDLIDITLANKVNIECNIKFIFLSISWVLTFVSLR